MPITLELGILQRFAPNREFWRENVMLKGFEGYHANNIDLITYSEPFQVILLQFCYDFISKAFLLLLSRQKI